MTLRLRRALILLAFAATILLATAIEYGVSATPTSHPVATGGTIISEN
jgi:hypothetical protein